jgi:hypothetical protein
LLYRQDAEVKAAAMYVGSGNMLGRDEQSLEIRDLQRSTAAAIHETAIAGWARGELGGGYHTQN